MKVHVYTCPQALVDELQVVRSERDSAVRERKTLQQTVAGLEQDKQVCCHSCMPLVIVMAI